jgi:hypothetical protein
MSYIFPIQGGKYSHLSNSFAFCMLSARCLISALILFKFLKLARLRSELLLLETYMLKGRNAFYLILAPFEFLGSQRRKQPGSMCDVVRMNIIFKFRILVC